MNHPTAWDSDGLRAKATVYFERAFTHDHDDPLFAFWCHLALEQLARAAVAKVNPALLAGNRRPDSLLYGLGVVEADPFTVESVSSFAVYSLCGRLVPGFGPAEQKVCEEARRRRNAELHSAIAAMEDLPRGWVGRFFAACRVLGRAEAKNRSAAHSARLDELEKVDSARRSLEHNLENQREELARLADVHSERQTLMQRWRDMQQERYRLVRQQCAALTDLSGGLIRATVRRSAGVDELSERFKAAVAGSGTWSTRIDEFFGAIASSDDPLLAWHTAVQHLEEVILAIGVDVAPAILPGSPLLRGFSTAAVERMAARLSTDTLLELALTPLHDEPFFEYRTKEGEYVAFEVASAGQQATALLRVLLNQPGPPLIIDQPEDDLDSEVIQEIVEQVWRAKRHRQLIFSSHNANLVVNGDAELVICCAHRTTEDQSGGRVKLEGAIDMPSVRKEITAVMEGGEPAFRLRKEKYGF